LEENPERLNPDWAAKVLGRRTVRALQETLWLKMLRKKLILIERDYSKTDRRLMAKDLDDNGSASFFHGGCMVELRKARKIAANIGLGLQYVLKEARISTSGQG
jgi:hypothetical protein